MLFLHHQLWRTRLLSALMPCCCIVLRVAGASIASACEEPTWCTGPGGPRHSTLGKKADYQRGAAARMRASTSCRHLGAVTQLCRGAAGPARNGAAEAGGQESLPVIATACLATGGAAAAAGAA